MDHQVEHDVYIQRTRSKDTEAVHFKKHGTGKQRPGGPDGGIKSLQVTDLSDAAMELGEPDKGVGLGKGKCQRLLDEHVQTMFHELARGFEVATVGTATLTAWSAGQAATFVDEANACPPYSAATAWARDRSASTTAANSTPSEASSL